MRAKYSEYDLFRFIFSYLSKKKKLRMLDICCGDSFILNHVSAYVTDYLGVDNNEKYSGCTVHFVNARLDSGKIILQKRVRIMKNETKKTLRKKILLQEHKLYPKAILKIFSP